MIARHVPAEATILGSAGLTEEEVEQGRQEQRERLELLSAALLGSRRGRPRSVVATIYLPRVGVDEFARSIPVYSVPITLHALAKSIVAAARLKKGPPTYSGSALERHVGNGGQDARNLRRLKQRLQAERRREAEIQQILDRDPAAKSPLSNTARAMLVGMLRF